jgi:GntR family transcriptional regulator/MocR family aminotransferase
MTDVHVTIHGKGDRADRIFAQLRSAILDGRLRPGERLLSSREMAARLSVSRNTVATAYDRLVSEGYLVSRIGAGTFVSRQAMPADVHRRAPAAGLQPRHFWSAGGSVLMSTPAGAADDCSVGTPDAGLFPLETWRRLVSRSLRPGGLGTGGYQSPAGNPRLRESIARQIGTSRSVRASAADVIVTQGAQQAFDMIGRVLIEPGDVVAVEEPGYPPVRRLFELLGARVVPVPVDREGLTVDAIPSRARLAYVTPSHQFPLGSIMSLTRRTALLEWAQRNDAAIIEDDYDSEYRYENRPLEPLQSLDAGGRVIYVGTLSKTLLPALRLGFVVAPQSLQRALTDAKALADWQGDYATQAAAAAFIDGGLLARHIRKANREYAVRRRVLIDTVNEQLSDLLMLYPSAAGLHVCARLSDQRIDAAQVAADAAELGVRVQSIAQFSTGVRPLAALALGFGNIARENIPDGLRLLGKALKRASKD